MVYGSTQRSIDESSLSRDCHDHSLLGDDDEWVNMTCSWTADFDVAVTA